MALTISVGDEIQYDIMLFKCSVGGNFVSFVSRADVLGVSNAIKRHSHIPTSRSTRHRCLWSVGFLYSYIRLQTQIVGRCHWNGTRRSGGRIHGKVVP